MGVKFDNRILIAGGVIVAILGIIALVTTPKEENYDYSTMTDDEVKQVVEERVENMYEKDLSEVTERDRMEYYVSEFISALENSKYEDAYNMLYDEFKTNYFPTLTSFEEYAKKTFPKMCIIEYTNIERNGNIHILWVTMSSALASKDYGVEMNFVIQENDLNDFVMSFSVI